MTSGSSCSSSRGVHPINDPIMAFIPQEVQAPTNQPRQSCQGWPRLGYHLLGSSRGTSCWLVCGSASKWKRFMCFSPNFHAWVLWKSSFLTVFQYSRFAKNTLGWWFFLHPRHDSTFFFSKRKDRVYYDPGSLGESASFNSVRKNDIKI